MKRISSILFLGLALFSLEALPEFTKAEVPTAEQEATMKALVKEIAEVQKDINTYYKDLEERNLVRESQTLIPISSEVQTYYGERDRYLLNEAGMINWQGQNIASFSFETRRARVGTGYIVKKRMSANTTVDPNRAEPLDLYVNELLTSGKGLTLNFRFAQPGEDVRDREEELTFNGRKQKVKVIYVRNMNQKLSIAREYFRLLKLLLRRVDWMVRSEEARKSAEIQRLMTIE